MSNTFRTVFVCLAIALAPKMISAQKADSSFAIFPKKKVTPCFIRPVFFEFSYRTLPAINHFPERNSSSDNDFKGNKLYSIKLNAPLLLSKKLNVIGQFRYRNEQLHIGYDGMSEMDEVHFNNIGMSFLFKYELSSTHFLAGHLGGFFKSDQLNFQRYSSILDYNSSFLVGKNIHRGTMGFGAVFGNSLGRFRLYPLFLLDYQFANTWRLEMKLPKEIQIRKILKPDSFYLIAGAEANGASYFIENDFYQNYMDLEYRRAAVDLRLGLEKEIFDFVWFGAEVGMTTPIYSALVETGRPTREKLIDFDHSYTPYASFSIFLVPPRSLFNKMR